MKSAIAPREKTGIPRLYKYTGKRKVSFQYFHRDGRTETLASAPAYDRSAIADARKIARRKAVDIEQGVIVSGSVAEMIDRFIDEIDPVHYRDQSRDGRVIRKSRYNQLKYTFGKMRPADLKMVHGYQHMDRQAKEGAPAGANKEMAAMQMFMILQRIQIQRRHINTTTDAELSELQQLSKNFTMRPLKAI